MASLTFFRMTADRQIPFPGAPPIELHAGELYSIGEEDVAIAQHLRAWIESGDAELVPEHAVRRAATDRRREQTAPADGGINLVSGSGNIAGSLSLGPIPAGGR